MAKKVEVAKIKDNLLQCANNKSCDGCQAGPPNLRCTDNLMKRAAEYIVALEEGGRL